MPSSSENIPLAATHPITAHDSESVSRFAWHSLQAGWRFRRLAPDAAGRGEIEVELPHCPFPPDLDGRNHWFGECAYRQTVRFPLVHDGERIALHVGAAMHTARVLIDGREVGHHEGGYLPFIVDLTAAVGDGAAHELTIRVDNRENPDIPPGKPFDELDFCWYGGLYRDVHWRVYPSVHITDPVGANVVAGGGIFARTLAATTERATVRVRTHVQQSGPGPEHPQVQVTLQRDGVVVATRTVAISGLEPGTATHVETDLEIDQPWLWSPESPALHDLLVAVVSHDGAVLDERHERIGIRRIEFSRSAGFVINGRRRRLRGTNRHQEFPLVGYAAPRAAQFRDARHLKEAGFDYVRLSHYPQSPDFLDACDELGIVVMNCLPGWQYFGNERFREACYAAARKMIRRDRNHPCIVLWELSLNETEMDESFMAQLHAIGHEESPGDQMFTCGWMDRYDVYLRSRQHGEIHTWQNADKALVIAEYGDWEFYADNAGFNQKTGEGRLADWSNARKLRAHGERGLRQQAWNHCIALNDTLASPAVLDGQWSMFDYARGYDPVRAACGVMDVFRLPKFSYFFYRSQRDPDESGRGWTGGPMVFIASHWLATSDLEVPVFSNCEEVELRLNGTVIARQARSVAAATQHLPHPPFSFHLSHFEPGVLEATGWCHGEVCCRHRIATPGPAVALHVVTDDAASPTGAGESDLVLVHAEWRDAHGILCVTEATPVTFALEGDGILLGPPEVVAEAGVASTAVRLPASARACTVRASAAGAAVLTATFRLRVGGLAVPRSTVPGSNNGATH